MSNELKESALAYSEIGLAVFPIIPARLGGDSAGKRPYISNGVNGATTDRVQIEKWWNMWPDANIGIATGEKSKGLVVVDLDIDEEKGKNGYEILKEWERDHGIFPETWTSITGRGGYHLFFKSDKPYRNKVDLYEGVDIRGEGGYIVAPPSLHASGRRYEWEFAPEDLEISTITKIVEDFIEKDSCGKERKKPYIVPNIVREGGRVQNSIKMVGSMKAKGFSREAIIAAVSAENEKRNVPPLTESELQHSVFPAIDRFDEASNPYNNDEITSDCLTDENISDIFDIFNPLIAIENQKLQEFPVNCLPKSIRSYIEAVAESLQVPKDMIASFVLTVLSLCAQGKWSIQVKGDWRETLNLYSVVIGRPSERKSPALNEVEKPLFNYMKKENERRKEKIQEYTVEKDVLSDELREIKRGIAKKNKKYTVSDAIDTQRKLDDLEVVKPLTLVLDDVTPEALVQTLKDNEEKMGIVSAEGGMFGIMMGRYGDNPNIDIFLKAYSGEYYSSIRVGREGAELNNPLLSVCLAVQPQVVSEIMEDKKLRGRGLLARFLYSVPNSRVGERAYRTNPVPEEVREKYYEICYSLLDMVNLDDFATRIIELSSEADELSEKYNQWIEKKLVDDLEIIEDWAGKLHGNTMRIAGILHIVKHVNDSILDNKVSAETMNEAIEIGKYYIEHAMAAFNIMGLHEPTNIKNARYVISRIMDNAENIKNIKNTNIFYISKRDVWDLCKGHFNEVKEMEPAFKCLEERGYISILKEKKEGKGRPSVKIYLNPEFLAWHKEQNINKRGR